MQTDKPTRPTTMRLAVRVDCIDRSDRASPYHQIRAIGGHAPDGLRWRLTEDAAIAAIDEERTAFYIESPVGHRIEIVAAQGLGKRYLKTESDGESPDRLLGLRDCG
jgi:hypothetical protein